MLDEEWVVKANCRATDKDYFFEKYEEDQAVAIVVDNICLTCPVIIDCFNHGTTNAEWGVWGGVYLESGEISREFNRHKTKEQWGEVWQALTTEKS